MSFHKLAPLGKKHCKPGQERRKPEPRKPEPRRRPVGDQR
jgi:hypothetical protein